MSFNEWKFCILSDIAELTMGQSPKGEYCNNNGEGLPLLNGPTEFGSHNPEPIQFTVDAKKVARKGALLFCVRGSTTGRMNWADQDYAIGRGLAAIAPKYEGTDRFIKAIVEYKLTELLNMATGSTFPNVTRKMLTDLDIKIPDIKEMIKINHIFCSIEDKIQINNIINKKLEEMAQAIFKQWFVDFEFPNEDGESYKSSGGEMVESELGMIPKGWEVNTVGNLAEVISKGTTPRKKDLDVADDNETVKFLKVRDIGDDGIIDLPNLEYIPKSIHLNQLKRSILLCKDVLISIAGTVGRVSYVDDELVDANTNQAVAFVRLKDIKKHFLLVMYKFKSKEFQDSVKSKIVQGVQANISLTVIKNEKLLVPTNDVLQRYNGIIGSIFNKKEIINKENNNLKNIRDTLHPKLMSGEIRVPTAPEEANM